MEQIKLDISRVFDFVESDAIQQMVEETAVAQQLLYDGTGAGNDFLGWLRLPASIPEQELAEMAGLASDIRKKTELPQENL